MKLSAPYSRPSVIAIFLLTLVAASAARADVQPVELKDGDRVAWIGGAFVERDQQHGYLETLLVTANPDKQFTFRNLGWSGDTVEGHARAVFGSPSDGFKRLLKDLQETKPTVIIVAYGANEAHAGEAGLAAFEKNLDRLLTELKTATDARLILVTPHRHEFVSPKLPDPNLFNAKLSGYDNVIRSAAVSKNCGLLDLSELVTSTSPPMSTSAASARLTNNGVHFTPFGYWSIAPAIARQFGVETKPVDVVIDPSSKTHQATGAKVTDLKFGDNHIQFTATFDRLPRSPAPLAGGQESSLPRTPALRITVKGLAKDKPWQILCDGQLLDLTGDSHLEHGGLVAQTPDTEQVEALRAAINKKNELYFHRHRPQNETYLFLFRKHEQGNNAVEIPQFDPLVAELEAQIVELKQPKSHKYEIRLAK